MTTGCFTPKQYRRGSNQLGVDGHFAPVGVGNVIVSNRHKRNLSGPVPTTYSEYLILPSRAGAFIANTLYPMRRASAPALLQNQEAHTVCQPITSPSTGRLGIFVRAQFTGSFNAYVAHLTTSDRKVKLGKVVSGTYTFLGESADKGGPFAEVEFFIRLRAEGTTISAKAWRTTETEPGSWDVSVTDTSIDGVGEPYHGIYVFPGADNITAVDVCRFQFLSWADSDSGVTLGTAPTPLSVAQCNLWVDDDSRPRVLLAEIGVLGQDSGGAAKAAKICASNIPFLSGDGDSPPSQCYDDIIVEAPTFTASASDAMTGRSQISFGDLILKNEDGVRDGWLKWNFDGRDIDLFVGALGWKKWDFFKAASATTDSAYAKAKDQIGLKVRGKESKLQKIFNSNLVGGTGPFAGEPAPYGFGQVFNIKPIPYDAATLDFKISHAGSVATATAVRDAGGSVAFTHQDSNRLVRLSAARVGTVTCDLIFGSAFYTHSLMFRNAALFAGLAAGEIDDDAPVTFASSAYAGICVLGPVQAIDVLDEIAASAGGFWWFDRTGLLSARSLVIPTAPFTHTLIEDDVTDLQIERIIRPSKPEYLYAKKNYTIQEGDLIGSVTEADRQLYAAPGTLGQFTPSYSGLDNPNNHLSARTPPNRVTLFVNQADAVTEGQRLHAIFQKMTAIVSFTVRTNFPQFEQGQSLHLTHSKYGFAAGKAGLIVGTSDNFQKGECRVKMFIQIDGEFPVVTSDGDAVGVEYFY